MLRFLRPSSGMNCFVLILLLLNLSMARPLLLYYFGNSPGNHIFLLLFLAEIAYCIFTIIRKHVRFKSAVRRMAENGELGLAVEDFSRAEGFFDDRFRTGYKYIFASGAGEIFAYDRITEVHEVLQYNPRRSNENPELWCLQARTTEGGESVLFIIRAKRTADAIKHELTPALNWIKGKAPHIKIIKGVPVSRRRPYYATLAGILIFTTIIFTGVLFFAYDRDRPLLRGRTADAQGIVTMIEEETHTKYGKGTSWEETQVYITVDYSVDGVPYETRKYSGSTREYYEGQEITITYNTDDPSETYLPGFAEKTSHVYYIIAGFQLVMLFGIMKADGKY